MRCTIKEDIMKKTVKTETIVRTVLLVLALINQLLTASGHAVLPIEDAQVEALISTAITVAMSVWAWWKNNSFTQSAIAADEFMETMKEIGE